VNAHTEALMARAIETFIESLPMERRLYPDTYADALAAYLANGVLS
jgi:hypothetical protein